MGEERAQKEPAEEARELMYLRRRICCFKAANLHAEDETLGEMFLKLCERKKRNTGLFHGKFLCCLLPTVALLGVPQWDRVKKCEPHLS